MLRRMGRAVNSLSSQKNSASSSSVLDSMYAAEVTRIRRETSRAVTMEFELLDGYRLNYKAGQFVTYDEQKHCLSNLFVRIANAMDVPIDSFGDSTGIPMSELFA